MNGYSYTLLIFLPFFLLDIIVFVKEIDLLDKLTP